MRDAECVAFRMPVSMNASARLPAVLPSFARSRPCDADSRVGLNPAQVLAIGGFVTLVFVKLRKNNMRRPPQAHVRPVS